MQNSEAELISEATKRELIARIIESRWFNKSERLTSLLLHVCELDLQGRAEEISEFQIGRSLFERPENYDPSVDGIVRSHASRLRMRLDQYFAREGRNEPIRLSIPRGAYLPLFTPYNKDQAHASNHLVEDLGTPERLGDSLLPQETQAPGTPNRPTDIGPVAVANILPSEADRSPLRLPALGLAWSLVALLTIALMLMYMHERNAHALPHAHPLWSAIFSDKHPTMIIAGDSSLVVWQDFMNRNIDLAGYLDSSYRTAVPADATSLQKKVALMAGRRYTSIVDLEVVQSLTQIAESMGGSLDMRYARDVRPNDLKQGNIILIGTAETNPWVALFEHDMNFAFDKDREDQIYSIINRNPQKGEPARWNYRENDTQHRVYGVVAYLPNLTADASVLILEGTAMAGTECARDFMTDEAQLLPFLDKIRRADGKVPHFEVVLGTDNINGSAVKSTILAWRTLP